MNLLKSQIQVEFKVKEASSGLCSDHEILIHQMQIDEKLKYDKYQITEVTDEDGKKAEYATHFQTLKSREQTIIKLFTCMQLNGEKQNVR